MRDQAEELRLMFQDEDDIVEETKNDLEKEELKEEKKEDVKEKVEIKTTVKKKHESKIKHKSKEKTFNKNEVKKQEIKKVVTSRKERRKKQLATKKPEIVLSKAEGFLELEAPMEEAKDVRVVAVASGKGGVGKTNFTLNLGLSEQKAGKKVLIIDIDFGFTNIDVLCGAIPNYTLQDVIRGERTIEEVIIEGPQGIKFIPGGKDALELMNSAKKHQEILKKELAKLSDIDVILIDAGAGINKSLILYTMFAQDLVVVINPEPTSYSDAYQFIKVMDKYEIKSEIGVVVNRAKDEGEANNAFGVLSTTVNKFLNVKLNYLGMVREDKCVLSSVRAQTPFIIKYPNALPSKDIRKIAGLIFKENEEKERKTFKQVLNRFMKVFS